MQTQSRPAWELDELRTAGRENFDEAHVERYDQKEDAQAAAEVALLRGLGLSAASTVLEFGPGTGQFTLAAAGVCGRVIAVDVSPVMLTRLRAKIANAGVTNVDVVHAGFLSYQHVGAPVDVVYSRYALHHLPDFWKALAFQRIRRLLRPKGVFRLWDVVYSFDVADAQTRIEAWMASFAGSMDEGWDRSELEEHIRDEHSTFTWLLEPMMERAGFAIEQRELSEDGFFAQYVLRAE